MWPLLPENRNKAGLYLSDIKTEKRPPRPADPSGEGGDAAHPTAVSMVSTLTKRSGPSDHISAPPITCVGWLPPQQ